MSQREIKFLQNNGRQLKFRGWNGQVMLKPFILGESSNDAALDYNFGAGNGLVIMQSTGLKDKNGKEIYEGDIIKDEFGLIGEIKWRKFGFEECMINTLGWHVIQEQGEIIGNIYETPNLLSS